MHFKKWICALTVIALLAGLLALTACQENAPSSTASSGSTAVSKPSESAKPSETQPSSTAPAPTTTAPTETQPAPSVPADPPEEENLFGLANLLAQPNADAMVTLYHQVEVACQSLQKDIPVSNLTLQELTMVLNHYRQDHPESFWFSSQFQYSVDNNEKILSVTLLYDRSNLGSLQFEKDQLDVVVEEILDALQEDMSDYDKALTLYDALIDRCDYSLTAPNGHNAYGALVEGQAVCEGYALAYQYLLMRAGIPAMYVTGFSREDHAWNAMQLDGRWYYADPTRDDPKGNDGTFRYYGYFGLTREMMDWDHDFYEDTIPLPEADSIDCNYYARMERIVTDFDLEQVKAWMKDDGDTLRIFVEEKPEDYLNQLCASINTIVIEENLPWYRYVYTINGREIIVRFYGFEPRT